MQRHCNKIAYAPAIMKHNCKNNCIGIYKRDGMSEPRVYVIVLNWNCWENTILCLESLLRSEYSNYCVVVCDNASTDDSEARILSWAENGLTVPLPSSPVLQKLVSPVLAKPIGVVHFPRGLAGAGGITETGANLALIQTGDNLGFAGGCNVGIRYALAQGDLDYVWLLNNDTIVTPHSLKSLVSRAKADPKIGICGSTLLGLRFPTKIQALGGACFRPSKGSTEPFGAGEVWPKNDLDVHTIETKMDYVVGASMLVSRAFLDTVGLLSEDYFLYFEELDWVSRAKGKFLLGYAPESIVYHIEGASTGKSGNLHYVYRSLVRFTWRHRRLYFPLIISRLLARFLIALSRGNRKEVAFMIGLFGKFPARSNRATHT
jgi:GT2 family glycosyltransferase